MSDLEISSKFNKNNILCVTIKNISKSEIKYLKTCCSLVYSIVSIDNERISKKIARYYEIKQLNSNTLIKPKQTWKRKRNLC